MDDGRTTTGARAARRPRPSTLFLVLAGVAWALVAAALLHARSAGDTRGAEVAAASALVGRLGLTDLCLFTEARYTRHPSQADLFSPFQDHPGALEHFPSGSLVPPPARPGP